MFGGPVERPKLQPQKPRKDHDFKDVMMPGTTAKQYGHVAREPNTNYHAQLLHYKQRSKELYESKIAKLKREYAREGFMQQIDAKVDIKRFYQDLDARVKEKMEEYDHKLEEKRERMRKLIAEDERESYIETVDQLQKGKLLKLEEIKIKIQKLRAAKEAERLKIVEQKRVQQYADRCEKLRDIMSNKNLIESKIIQQQQIRENESRRQAEKEIDAMWKHVMLKELENRMYREEQEAMDKHKKITERQAYLELQIKGKLQAQEEAKRMALEERLEFEKMAAEYKKRELEGASSVKQKRIKLAEELRAQIEFQRVLLEERTKAERDLETAYSELSRMQLEREQAETKDYQEQAHRELEMYRTYLKHLEEKKKIEDAHLEQLLEDYRLEVEKKQDEAKCKVAAAKKKLLDDTVKGVADQLKAKLELAQQELKEKEAENELMRLHIETSKRLVEEQKRSQACNQQKYREELEKQIAYNKVLKDRENAELERVLELGRKQEEEYRKKVDEIIELSFEYGGKHPFRKVLEQYDCKCPPVAKIQPKY